MREQVHVSMAGHASVGWGNGGEGGLEEDTIEVQVGL